MGSIKDNEALKIRVGMVNGMFALDEATKDFMPLVRRKIEEVAADLVNHAPDTCDIGRLIAAVDMLQQAKNTFIDSAILGCEATSRKRKAAESTPDASKKAK
jgi:hypothetical protein